MNVVKPAHISPIMEDWEGLQKLSPGYLVHADKQYDSKLHFYTMNFQIHMR